MGDEGISSYLVHFSDKRQLCRKRIAVVGLGKSNMALLQFLAPLEPRVTVYDQQPPEQLSSRVRTVRELIPNANFVCGPSYLTELATAAPFDYLFVTPGIRKDQPELLEACRRGAGVSSEMSLFFDLCPAPITGITGSAGKTTTTALTGDLLGAAGQSTHVGGNIGTPLTTRIPELDTNDRVVVELSSFQLELLEVGPAAAAVLNISPNHLDVHGTMEAYVAAKARICRFQPPEAAAVLNFDCPETRGLQQSCPGRVYFFSMEHQVATGAYLKAGRIILVEENQPLQGWEGLPISAIPLRGSHNIANVMAALLLAYVNGIPPEYYEEAVRSFKAVPHRLEHVGSVGGVDYYNDSIATAPDRTVAALHSFSEPVVLIAGGYDKGLSFEPVARELVGSVARLILLGDTAEAIEEAVRQAAADTGGELPPVHHVSTLEEAVNTAAETAPAGSVVLLSPACASYDMFDNFEVRGDTFRRLVHSL